MSLCSAQAVVCYNSLKSVGWVKKIWVISSNVNTLLICPEFESLVYSKPPWIIRIISLNCLCLLMPTIIPQQHPAVSLTVMPRVLTASSHSAFLYPFVLSTWCLRLQKLQKWWGRGPFFTIWHVLSSICDFKHCIMDTTNLRLLETWIDLES